MGLSVYGEDEEEVIWSGRKGTVDGPMAGNRRVIGAGISTCARSCPVPRQPRADLGCIERWGHLEHWGCCRFTAALPVINGVKLPFVESNY